MRRTLYRRAAVAVAAAGAALVLGAGPALAVGGWAVVAAPPAGQNATLTSVATGSTDGAGAVATNPGAATVWAVGESGPAGSFNPLVLRNG